MGVNFLNISQYGNANFRVGDQWQLTASGPPGETVYVYGSFNGKHIGGGPQGTIGADGQLVKVGSMGENQVGVWVQQWYVGAAAAATYNFVVVGADE